jgi:GTP-binding protein
MTMRFVDEVTLEIAAGDGGDGSAAFRREAGNPRGGPAGGDGGKGGDIVMKADRNVGTLLDLRSQSRVRAERGQKGMGSDCHGRCAPPKIIKVPVGTLIIDEDTEEVVGDLVVDGQEVIAAHGGRGGFGNMHYTTSSNRAPRRADPGYPGEVRNIRLELKLLADVGLVGFPNAGKSTLISALSAARPKIADYPFTTLVPNLGVVDMGMGASSFVMADIPGLIEGAADGAGLGSRFLKHVQRTAVLLFVLAPRGEEDFDPIADFKTLRKEIEKFDPEMAKRPKLAVLNKIDIPEVMEMVPSVKRSLTRLKCSLLPISAAGHIGLDTLKKTLQERISNSKAQSAVLDVANQIDE